ncbi:MAG TPA: transcription antitermination factor NusB, partial [Lysobacter sp.]
MSRRRDGVDPVARSRARRRAMQAVYAWQMSGSEVGNVIAQFAHEQAKEVADLEYFEDLVRGVDKNQDDLDEALAPFLDRDIEQVDPIERAVLRLAAYELRMRPDVPYRVVINEAIETV